MPRNGRSGGISAREGKPAPFASLSGRLPLRAAALVVACALFGAAAPARSTTYHDFAEDVTHLGDASTLLGVGLALGLSGDDYDKRTSAIYAEALVTSGAATYALKRLTRKQRPDPQRHGGYAFPSAHAAGSFAAATVLARRYPRHRSAYYVVAGLVAASRVELRAHDWVDVTAGAALGIYAGKRATVTERGIIIGRITW